MTPDLQAEAAESQATEPRGPPPDGATEEPAARGAFSPNGLKAWLSQDKLPPGWRGIGGEVRWRKTLMLAAAEELNGKPGIRQPLILAAADVFVEKAQRELGKRAGWLMLFGGLSAAAAVGGLAACAWYVYHRTLDTSIGSHPLDGYTLTFLLVKSGSAMALAGGALVFLATLANSLLHEATGLYSRRHALRLGRLYVYMKQGELKFDEFEEAIKWNAKFASAFKGKTLALPKHPGQSLAETLWNGARAVARNARRRKPADRGETRKDGARRQRTSRGPTPRT